MDGMYIHIPFCDRICSYCDFAKVLKYDNYVFKYLDSLDKEIDTYYKGEPVKTLYIGGGTPSSLNSDELDYLFKILKKIDKSNLEEYTFECNVNHLNDTLLDKLKNEGITRLSIGVQSFNQDVLTYLNRDIYINISCLKNHFNNINIDLIYAIPNFSIDILKKDLETLLKLDIKHVSCYSLMIEKRTKLYVDKVKPISEELDYDMYKLIDKTLTDAGFIHYEVSNYAKEGYMSKHNLTYWNNDHYYGFGLNASGYIEDIRYTNTGNLNRYLKNDYDRSIEKIDQNLKMEYEMILGLRKLKGVSKQSFLKKYGIDIKDRYKIDNLLKEKKLLEDEEYIYINPKYIYLSNDILINFV